MADDDASNATKTRVIGKPFQPGNSGGGRPKMPEEMKLAFREHSQTALNTLVDIMTNGDKNSDRVKASEVILDRAWGKAAQTINADINTGIKVLDTSKLSKEQVEAIALLAVSNMDIDDQP